MAGRINCSLNFNIFATDMELDWEKYIIFQKDTSEPLKCPLQSPGVSDKRADAFLLKVELLIHSQQLFIFGSDESAESAESFSAHCASLHKPCHLRYNNSKLQKSKEKKPLHCCI